MKYPLRLMLWLFLCVHTNAGASMANRVSSEVRGAIKDLSVTAIPYDKTALQLRISWHAVDLKDIKLDVRLKPIARKHCSLRPCDLYGIGLTTTEVLLPKDPMPTLEHRECTVEPGCSYRIFVETADRKVQSTLSYSVPDCVGDICSCKHAAHLPRAFVTAKVQPSRMTIYWNISLSYSNFLPNDVELEAIHISIGIQMNPSLTWGGQYKNLSERVTPLVNSDGSIEDHGEFEIELEEPVNSNSQYVIRAYAADSKGCAGEPGNFTYFLPGKPRAQSTKSFLETYQFLFSLIFSATLFLIVITVFYASQFVLKVLHKTASIPQWRGVYHNVEAGTTECIRVTPQIEMQPNSSYVDKDIFDARARGEADSMEVPHSSLVIGRQIGKGAFGRVYIARANNINGSPGIQVVAVKKLKTRPSPEQLEEFLTEIATMKTVSRHPNVVALIGCCTIRQPFLMIMEYIGYGDLLQYLRQARAKHEARSTVVSGVVGLQQLQKAQTNQLERYDSMNSVNALSNGENSSASNTTQKSPNNDNASRASGPMGKYLEILHSSSSTASVSEASYATNPGSSFAETMFTMLSHDLDLMSTNYSNLEYVLDHKELHNFAVQIARGMAHLEERQITHRDLAARNILIDETKTLKISDFGLSRTGIYVNTRNRKVPLRWLSIEAMRDNLYSNKSDVWAFGVVLWEIGTLGGFPYPTVSNHELLAFLRSGQRLQRPENCSEELYQLMLKCWADNQHDRPRFSDILNKLEPSDNRIYVDFNDLKPNYVFPPTAEKLERRKSAVANGETENADGTE